MRFLFRWQNVEPDAQKAGLEGLMSVLEQFDGFELPAAAWEGDVLPARCKDYVPDLTDMLCLSGRIRWGRASLPTNGAARPIRSSPIAFFTRASHMHAPCAGPAGEIDDLSVPARDVHAALEDRGASFFHELTAMTGLSSSTVEQALAELVAAGLATADSFAGLRALLTPSASRYAGTADAGRRRAAWTVDTAGRWSLLRQYTPARVERNGRSESSDGEPAHRRLDAEKHARALLRRWGVLFRRLLDREPATTPTWRELVLACRRLEARGEIRGGRFVRGFAGEQFALPEAVPMLRSARRAGAAGQLISLSAADPLNLTGIVTPEDRVAAIASNRILYRDGVPVAAFEGGDIRWISVAAEDRAAELEHALTRRSVSHPLRQYLRVSRKRRRAGRDRSSVPR
jgi:ATP-dependent Lhr-like helicase